MIYDLFSRKESLVKAEEVKDRQEVAAISPSLQENTSEGLR